jgi:hypothetical protein
MRKLLSFACVVVIGCWLGSARSSAQGAGAPILVVVDDAAPNPFGTYLPEILRAEGLNSFNVIDLGALNAGALTNVRLVVLAEMPLSGGDVTTLTNFVNGGGRLVAMRPPSSLNTLLGIADGAGSTVNGYTLIDQAGPGAGLQNVTLPFKGDARHMTLGGAAAVAALHSPAGAPTGFPAVVRFGRTAAWSFDLARSTAFTRQGNPADATERDGLPIYRTSDLFFDRIDKAKMGIPHADVQMRLFSRVVTELLADAMPVPRLWYFPGGARTILIPTADSHVGQSEAAAYTGLISATQAVGARISFFIARFIDPTGLDFATWVANGHEVGVHPVFNEDMATIPQGYDTVYDWFALTMPVAPGRTERHHTLEWLGWVDPTSTMEAVDIDIDMDFSYSAFGPAVHLGADQFSQAHGYITGSGLPMRFVTQTGAVKPTYQQVTSLADEQLVFDAGLYSEGLSAADALTVSRSLIDASQAGGYSAIATNFHVDYYLREQVKPWVDGTLAYAAAQGIPMWTAGRWLNFTQARAATTMSNLAWTPASGLFSFTITVPGGAEAQPVLLPAAFGGVPLARVTVDGTTVAPQALTVNGQTLQMIQVTGGAARQVTARYVVAGSRPISISDGSGVEGNAGTSVASLTVSIPTAAADDIVVSYATSDGSATAPVDYQPASGSVIIPAGATSAPLGITIRGDGSFEGDETVIVTLSNPLGGVLADATGVLTIVNDEPIVTVADVYATPYRTPLGVAAPGVLANDNPHGSPTMTAILVSTVSNGTLSLSANGAFTYTPNTGFVGADTFRYRAETVNGPGNPATVTINVAAPTTVQPATDLRVAAMAGNRVTFRWNAPPIGPAAAGYVLEGGVVPGQPMVAVATGLAAPIFEIVAPSGSFYVRIRTLGAGGPSDPSNEILAHINVPAPPSAPAAFQATSVGDSVHLSWAPTFAGGAPGGYVLDVSGSIAAALPLPNLERLSFVGVPGGAYTLSVRAVNGGGSSGPTAAVAMPVPGACAGPPGVPTNLLSYVAGGTTFIVWDPPLTGSAVSSYLLTVPGVGALPLAQRTISGPLPAGVWSITVQAVGPCGASAPVTRMHNVP